MKYTLILIYSLFYCTLFSQLIRIEKVEFKFEVNEFSQVNSEYSDFGVVKYGNKVLLCSDRDIDQVNTGENAWKKGKHYNLIYFETQLDSVLGNDLKYKGVFYEKFTSKSHTGPICFSESGDTVFISMTVKSKLKGVKTDVKFKPQLFISYRTKNGFTSPELLEINLKGYSSSHPSYNSATNTLYFASDREGGLGGTDLYSSKLDANGKFSSVENLGENVNTELDESFPFSYQNELFFSSDKKGGVGGLDLYWTYLKNETWQKGQNLGPSINSDGDDFSMNIYNGTDRGFITSSKSGNDEVYQISMEKKLTVFNELSGSFAYRNIKNDVSGIKIQATSDDIDMIFETSSDENGKFKMRELPGGHKYTIKVLNDSEEDLYVTFYDDNGNVLSEMIINGQKNFHYKKLDNSSSLLAVIDNSDDFDFSQDYTFKVVNDDNLNPADKVDVHLVDEYGNTKSITQTDAKGNFQFKEIDYNSINRFMIKDSDEDYSMFVFNSKGEVVSKLKGDENGVFNYRKLDTDQNGLLASDDEEIDFTFNKTWFSGELKSGTKTVLNPKELQIEVLNFKGEVLGVSTMNESGRFYFEELPIEESYLFETKENVDESFDFWLYDYKGEVIAKIVRNKESGYFIYRNLNNEVTNLSEEDYAEDDSFDFGTLSNETSIKVVSDQEKKNGINFSGELVSATASLPKSENIKIEVFNSKQELIGTSIMAKNGRFNFNELPIEEVYLFQATTDIDESFEFWLYNDKNELIAKVVKNEDSGFFVYQTLNSDLSELSEKTYDEESAFNFGNNLGNSTSNNVVTTQNNGNESSFNSDSYSEKNTLYFEANSSYLSGSEKLKLRNLVSKINAHKGKIVLEGHADVNGDVHYNNWISKRRGQRVLEYLVTLGVDATKLSLSYFGEDKPEIKCTEEDCDDKIHRQNRRVVLLFE